MPIARVRDIEICYELGGTGPRLLKIRGTGGDLRRPPSDFDRRLTAQFTVLAFDQRGMGRAATAALVVVEALAATPDPQKVMPPAQPGAVSPADGAGDTAIS